MTTGSRGLLVQPPQPGNAIAIGIRSRRQAARRVFSRDKLGQSANPAHAAIAQCCLEVASTLSRLASASPARHCPDEENAEHRPASSACPHGGRLQIGMAEIKSESVADFARNTKTLFRSNARQHQRSRYGHREDKGGPQAPRNHFILTSSQHHRCRSDRRWADR